jgi:hypothetical protein
MVDKNFADLRMNQTRLPADATAVTSTMSQALKDGEVLADNGESYATVQAAQDAAQSWIRLPPETFNEAVTIDTAGLSVVGSGYDTHIAPSSNTAINVNAQDVTVTNVSVTAGTPDGQRDNNGVDGVFVGSNGARIQNITVRGAEDIGVRFKADDSDVVNCTFQASDGSAVRVGRDNHNRLRVLNCHTLPGVGNRGVSGRAHDCVIAGNVIISPGDRGINLQGPDTIAYGNRVHNSGDSGIAINDQDMIVVNNRVSNSGVVDIENNGNGIIRDNITGASN